MDKKYWLLSGFTALLLFGADLSAATYTWVGGTSSNDPTVGANWGGITPGVGDTGEIDITTNSPTMPASGSPFTPENLSFGITGVIFNIGTGAAAAPSLTFSGGAGTGVLNMGAYTTTFNLNTGNITFGGTSGAGNGTGSTTIYNVTAGSTFTFSGTSVGNDTLGGLVQINLSGTGTANALNFSGISVTLDSLSDTSAPNFNTVALNGNVLTVGNASNQTISSLITGGVGSGLTLEGTGAITLTGTNTYTGPTLVTSGGLVVGSAGIGSITSSATLENGATLSGTGLITGTVTIESGATIIPGNNAIGTLNIAGPLVMDTGATTNIELNPTSTSLIDVTGAATLAGNVNILTDPGSYANSQTYTIVSATSGFGASAFSSLTLPIGFLGSLDPSANNINLILNSLRLNAGNFSGNNKNVANALNAFQFISSWQSLLTQLYNLPLSQQTAALESISPARSAFTTYASMMGSFSTVGMVASRLSDQRIIHSRALKGNGGSVAALDKKFEEDQLMADASEPYGSAKRAARNSSSGDENCLWLQGFGDFARQDGQNQTPTFTFTNGGGLLGYDYFGYEHGLFGAAGGYVRTTITDQNDLGSASINSFVLGPYGTGYFNNAYAEVGAFFSYNRMETNRHVFFTGFEGNATATHSAYQLTPHIGIGYDVAFSWGYFEPYATVDYVADWEKSYTEHGVGLLDMTVNSRFCSMLRSEVGLQVYEDLCFCWGVIVLKEKVAYLNKKPFSVGKMTAAVVGSLGTFSVTSFTETQNQFTGSFEILMKGNSGWFAAAEYDGEFGAGYMSNQIMGKFGIYF